jgi:hypothetical protein
MIKETKIITLFLFVPILFLFQTSCATTGKYNVTYTPIFLTDTAINSLTPSNTIIQPTLNEPEIINAWNTQEKIKSPMRTPIEKPDLSSYPFASEKDGNIYFHKNRSEIIQLTKSGKDRMPILSHDGKRIAFLRGGSNYGYIINSDGSNLQMVISNETQIIGSIVFMEFIPGTYDLLINSFLCESTLTELYDYENCTIGIYKVNTSIKEISIIKNNIIGNVMGTSDKIYSISPNGELVAISSEGSISVYSINTQHNIIIYENILSYPITRGDEYYPRQYWFPDSTGIIIIIPGENEYNSLDVHPQIYKVFKYKLGENEAHYISLNQYIIYNYYWHNWCVSPDRNWILFSGNTTGDPIQPIRDYLGSLLDGNTTEFMNYHDDCRWSSDSKHWTFLGDEIIWSIDKHPFPIGGSFLQWVTNKQYYYYRSEGLAYEDWQYFIGSY